MTGGSGNDYVRSGGGYINIGDGKNNVSISKGSSTIISGSGDDTINLASTTTSRYYNVINAGAGNNYINNSNVERSTIVAGSGDDTIITGGWYSSINAGNGNNLVNVNTSYGNTVVVGGGNDTVTFNSDSSSNVVVIAGGNNVINNIGSNSTVKMIGTVYSTISGSSMILASSAGAVVTLTGAGATSVKHTVVSAADTVFAGIDVPSVSDTTSGDTTPSDTTSGGGGTDTSSGGGSDTTSGGGGTDTSSGGGGTDTNSGGNDTTSGGGNTEDYTLNSGKTAVTLGAEFEGTFDLGDYASTIKTVVGSSQTGYDVEIIGNDKANKLVGGAGDDTLNGKGGNDTLTGGDGDDIFVYESGGGKDVITDYEEGVDRVIISGDYVSASSVKGSDVVFKVGKGTLTLKKAKDKEITVTDELGEHTRVYGNDMFLTDSDKAKIKAKSKIITIDATARTTAINITGSSKANTILGGSGKNTISGGSGNDYLVGNDEDDKILGGSGADTLISGGGNDTMTGGAGKDIFYYESGNDIITDYKASQKDEIVLTNGTIDAVSVKGSNVIFTIGDGQLTIKSGKSQTITITDADGNKTSQKYTKSSSFEERSFIDEYWFATDNNFATTDENLLMDKAATNAMITDYDVTADFTSIYKTTLAKDIPVAQTYETSNK